MRLLKRLFILSVMAIVAVSCSTGYYSSMGTPYDDLYATHDRVAIATRQKAEAEARKAEAEARKAEYEAQLAQLQAMVTEAEQKASTRTDSDGVIIVDEGASYNSYIADDYESAYARRLLGFKSSTYRMPSSYYDLRYGSASHYVTAYDPAFYNVMMSGSQVWVEPRYITSMFGSWGAVNVTMVVNSPWYYGFGPSYYDPFYYSSWGYPRYSWYDWNWNICYGYGGMNLWWGWGGMYRPWHYTYYPHYHLHHHHLGGPHYGIHFGGGGGYWNRGGSYYGSRNNNTRFDGPSRTPSRGNSLVNRTSGRSTPYRSPSTGATYGDSSRGNSGNNKITAPSQQPSRTGSVGRNNNTRRSGVGQSSSSSSRQGSYQNNSQSNQHYNQNSQGRSSYSSGSSFGSGSSFNSGSRSSGMSGGGGSRSSGSRGR